MDYVLAFPDSDARDKCAYVAVILLLRHDPQSRALRHRSTFAGRFSASLGP